MMGSQIEAIEFLAPSQELANKYAVLFINKLHDILSGPRSGRWYPTPGNPFYSPMVPVAERALNYKVLGNRGKNKTSFVGASTREEIMGGAYQASAPGEAPAVRTGRLRQSFHAMIIKNSQTTWKASITTNVEYADALEHGTVKVSARPFIQIAIEEIKPLMMEEEMKELSEIIRGERQVL
jgi:hypothetical protein